jgi:hypothetical protein
LSGAAALVFENLWFRQAGLAFGNSVWASSLVLASFMGGMFLGSLLLWGLAQLHITQIPQLWTTADVQHSVVFFLGFIIIDVLTCIIAFALERHEDWTLLIPVLLQRFYYRQLMYIVLFRSVKEAVSGRPVGWRGVEHEPHEPGRNSHRGR